MNPHHIQMLLASAGYYRGAIDGQIGPMSRAAINRIEVNAKANRKGWSWSRRSIAAAQAILDAQGYEPGAVDGFWGHNTREAVTSWLSVQAGTSAAVVRNPVPAAPEPVAVPRQSEMANFYGTPGPQGTIEAALGYAIAPVPLRLDWDLKTTVTRLRVHQHCIDPLTKALQDIIDHYGEAEWRRLGLDRYAGGYNPRQMRGGSNWSTHAYGCAVDFFAAPNALRTRCPNALFCGAQYQPFLDIMQSYNWLPAVRLWGADAMHFQMARL